MPGIAHFRSIVLKNRSNLIVSQTYLMTVRSTGNSSSTNSDVSNGGPLAVYTRRVQSGELHQDEHQLKIIGHLQTLHNRLIDYTPKPLKSDSILSKLFGTKAAKLTRSEDYAKKYGDSPNGLYLYGSVGCGKTMLMDLFHDSCPIEKKQRVHFHQFMLNVRQRIHAMKKELAPKNLNRQKAYDPIPPVAKEIGEHTWLLCFDEFQVTDIADAMILKRLFSYLYRNGVVVIATSNRAPDDLYKNGLQRIHFLPFIPMLKMNCDTHCLDSRVDYRRRNMPAAGKLFFVHSECDSKYEMDRTYEDLVSREEGVEGPRTLNVMNRDVYLPNTCGRILDCKFSDLCMRPLGAADYLGLCEEFDIILLRDIPKMSLEQRTEARRFITMIDTLYDHRMRLVCSAEAKIDELFAVTGLSDYDKHHHRVLIGDLDINKGDDNESASLFTGEEELFAFERVMSRLNEMQSDEYWGQRGERKERQEKHRARIQTAS